MKIILSLVLVVLLPLFACSDNGDNHGNPSSEEATVYMNKMVPTMDFIMNLIGIFRDESRYYLADSDPSSEMMKDFAETIDVLRTSMNFQIEDWDDIRVPIAFKDVHTLAREAFGEFEQALSYIYTYSYNYGWYGSTNAKHDTWEAGVNAFDRAERLMDQVIEDYDKLFARYQ